MTNIAPQAASSSYHVIAFVKRGDSLIAHANGEKSSRKFKRIYESGPETVSYDGHAEMILCDRVNLRANDTVHVVRFLKDGTATMAKPCKYCQRYLYNHGVKTVKYTDWKGQWKKLKL